MSVFVDDVGSFPLPTGISRSSYEDAYDHARKILSEGRNLTKEYNIQSFSDIVLQSFRRKLATGLDIVSYPQLFDMYRQHTDAIEEAMEKGTYVVEEKNAVLPEVRAIAECSKTLSNELHRAIRLRVCLTGPMELYMRLIGTAFHKDVLSMFAETVKRYAKNALFNSKYLKTEVVTVDEPSFGFREIDADKNLLIKALEKGLDFSGATKQIHLHSASRLPDLLAVRNLDVLSFEFGASPKNIEAVPKRMLDEADKRLRVGIARTDYDSLLSESRDKAVSYKQDMQLVEDERVIRDRFRIAKREYDDRIIFAGPDCGLGGWRTQDSAQLLLERTVAAVKNS